MTKQVINIANEPSNPFFGVSYLSALTQPVRQSPHAIIKRHATDSTGLLNNPQPTPRMGIDTRGNQTSARAFVPRPVPPTPLKVCGLIILAAPSRSVNPVERIIGQIKDEKSKAYNNKAVPPKK